ncbi:hypothetical protein [Caulobacter sp. S45]|uniref:hypothetical protein n=1 Tax=Caulobacter sp. S45 TaxID=1641861 RepID=UPI0015755EC6|nr:hypothetical protein [Caulobacter sp. S45]
MPDFPKNAKTLSILTLRPDIDRLGNPDAHSFLTVEFTVDDLRAAHVDRLGAYGTLDLATDVQVVLPWQNAVAPWCAEHSSAGDFCARAKASLGPDVSWPEGEDGATS